MPIRHDTLREGILTGVLGASAVALWFLLVDALAGVPLFTPATLGAALFGVESQPVPVGTEMLLVVGYTVFHFAAFAVVGVVAVHLIHLAEQQTALLALFLIFFVIFEMGFYGLVAVLNEIRLLNGLEWYQIAIGNLLSSVVMGTYLWRAHPALRGGLADALSH